MPSYPLMQGKRGVVFGAGGSIGSEVAKVFASGGAEVLSAGPSEESLKVVGSRVTGSNWVLIWALPRSTTRWRSARADRMSGIAP